MSCFKKNAKMTHKKHEKKTNAKLNGYMFFMNKNSMRSNSTSLTLYSYNSPSGAHVWS